MGSKIRFYVSSVFFGMIVLVCTFSIYQQWAHSRIVMFDVCAIAGCLPLAVYAWRKAGSTSIIQEIEEPTPAPGPLPQRARVLLRVAIVNLVFIISASIWGLYSDDYTLLIALSLIDVVFIVGLKVYKKVTERTM